MKFTMLKLKSKKGISMVITAVLLIALTVVIIAIVGTTTKKVVDTSLDKAGSCFGVFEKVKLNDDYTCYNASSNLMQVSIEREDFEMDELLIAISFGDSSRNFILTDNNATVYGVYPYKGSLGEEVSLPTKEGGKTYIVNETLELPTKIQIAPIVGGNPCDVSDTSTTFPFCF